MNLKPVLIANLARCLAPGLKNSRERYESFRDGGGGVVSKPDVVTDSVDLQKNEESLVLTANKDGASFEATTHALDLPEDWKGYGSLHCRLRLQGPIEGPVLVSLAIIGARNRIIEQFTINDTEVHDLVVPLGDLPLAAGTRPPWTPTGFRLTLQWGDTWQSEGERVLNDMQWLATANNEPLVVELSELRLHPQAEHEREAVVDEFGQRARGSWPTKINSNDHFQAVKEAEEEWLQNTPCPGERSQYGGWTGGQRYEATGFFRVTQDNGRWWYIDPEGYPFWSIGTTGIRVSDTTQLEEREELFAGLPPREDPWLPFYDPPIGSPANDGKGKEVVSFYLLNCLRKFGNLNAWRDHVLKRLQTVGFNTAGNWSDELFMAQRELPHTRALQTNGAGRRVGSLPDVFDPEWAKSVDANFSAIVSPQKDNPWLIGYFVDNEMGWRGLKKQVFDLPPNSPCRQEFDSFLSDYFKQDLDRALQELSIKKSVSSWEELTGRLSDCESVVKTELVDAFMGHFAEKYFKTVRDTLRRYDPNHLYLGCRFVRRQPVESVCAAAGRYSDVVTINCYDLFPKPEEFSVWYAATGRPIQIGEHHLPLRSERQLAPLYPAFTEEEREKCYEHFVRTWANQPYSVGCHWFQHADQNATGRPCDGENQTVGFVDITDQPHPELIAAAMRVTRSMYHWHMNSSAS